MSDEPQGEQPGSPRGSGGPVAPDSSLPQLVQLQRALADAAGLLAHCLETAQRQDQERAGLAAENRLLRQQLGHSEPSQLPPLQPGSLPQLRGEDRADTGRADTKTKVPGMVPSSTDDAAKFGALRSDRSKPAGAAARRVAPEAAKQEFLPVFPGETAPEQQERAGSKGSRFSRNEHPGTPGRKKDTDETITAAESSKGKASVTMKKGVFGNSEAMKEKVRQAVFKPEYSVMQFYKETGCCQRIARHAKFENVTLGVIVTNALWMSIESDGNRADVLLEAEPLYFIMEHLFCAYFLGEWLIRFGSFERKRNMVFDFWMVFDGILAFFMTLETWFIGTLLPLTSASTGGGGMGSTSVLKLLRLIRLTRLARMAKVLRAIPELMILVKGMLVATKAVVSTLALLTIIIYVFAIAFTQLCRGTSLEKTYFGSVPSSMTFLLITSTVPDLLSIVQEDIGAEDAAFAVVYLIFILLSTFTVMNMLVGVLVEVVSMVSSVEKETMEATYVKDHLLGLLSTIDANTDGLISKEEFESLLELPEAAVALQSVGVDVVSLVDFSEMIFMDEHGESSTLTFDQVMALVLQLRGQNKATVKDLVDMRKFVVAEVGRSEKRLKKWLDQNVMPPISQTLKKLTAS